MTRTMLLGRMVETTRTVLLLCHMLRDSRLAVFFVLAVVGTAERAGVGPSTPVYTGSNCTGEYKRSNSHGDPRAKQPNPLHVQLSA